MVTAANILGAAALHEGKYAQSFPFFGAERRGAPVLAFTRIANRPIRLRSQIYTPQWVVLLDDTLLEIANPLDGLPPEGTLVVNTRRESITLPVACRLIALDATAIALELLGRPVANTAILGALAAAGLIGLTAVKQAIAEAFPGAAGEINARVASEAYDAVARTQHAREVGRV